MRQASYIYRGLQHDALDIEGTEMRCSETVLYATDGLRYHPGGVAISCVLQETLRRL